MSPWQEHPPFADRAFSPSGVRPPRRLRGCQRDADRLAHDPAMRAVVGRSGLDHRAVSTSQMGSCYTAWLTGKANLAALTDLSGAWIDRVHARKPSGRHRARHDAGSTWVPEGDARPDASVRVQILVQTALDPLWARLPAPVRRSQR